MRIRSKDRQLYYYCVKKHERVLKTCYTGCFDKEYKKTKPISKKSTKQVKIEKERFSILQDNLDKCYFCENKATDWHELLKGSNRKNCIKWGLCVRICRICHEKTENDSSFYKNMRKVAQIEWQKYYNKGEDEFIKIFKRSYLD